MNQIPNLWHVKFTIPVGITGLFCLEMKPIAYFVFDRLGFERPAQFIMTPSLSIPLGLMYGKNTDQDLEIIINDTQKTSKLYGLWNLCNSSSH